MRNRTISSFKSSQKTFSYWFPNQQWSINLWWNVCQFYYEIQKRSKVLQIYNFGYWILAQTFTTDSSIYFNHTSSKQKVWLLHWQSNFQIHKSRNYFHDNQKWQHLLIFLKPFPLDYFLFTSSYIFLSSFD